LCSHVSVACSRVTASRFLCPECPCPPTIMKHNVEKSSATAEMAKCGMAIISINKKLGTVKADCWSKLKISKFYIKSPNTFYTPNTTGSGTSPLTLVDPDLQLIVSQLQFNVPFQHKYGYIRDKRSGGVESYPYPVKEGQQYILQLIIQSSCPQC